MINRNIFFLTLLLICSVVKAENGYTQLQQQVAQNNFQQAWQQAQALAETYEGKSEFDFLYGISALETGNYDQAVFALDRAVIGHPNNARFRLELARAYLKVKNQKAAIREFHEALKLNPPAAVRQAINLQLVALSIKDKSVSPWAQNGRLSFAVGYDTNANFGAENAIQETPVFGTVTLNELSVEQSSPFAVLQGQFDLRYVPSEKITWFAGSNIARKQYREAGEFDLSQFDTVAGFVSTSGRYQYQLGLKNRLLWLDSDKYKRATAIQAGVSTAFGDGTLAATLEFGNSRYPEQSARDVSHYDLVSHYRIEEGNLLHQFSTRIGQERADQDEGNHHARKSLGVGYSLAYSWENGQSSSVSVDMQWLRHRANDPVYAKKRRDRRLGLRLGHALKLDKKTSVFVNAGWIDNQSNLNLYDTDKTYVQAGINYNF